MFQIRTPWHREALVIPWYSLYLLLTCFAGRLCLSIGVETISLGQTLSGSQTLVSQDGTFELGFFSTGNSNNIYLGIWYKDFGEKAIVWTANRDTPISSGNTKVEISEDGNLVLLNKSGIVWSTNLVLSQPITIEAVLLDTGNFVLRESSKPSTILWQSFDYPTDTWLPGAKLGFRILSSSSLEPQRLSSWKNSEDPSPGMFSLVIDTDTSGGQLFLEWNKSVRYWTTGIWTGEIFSLVPEISYTAKFTLVSTPNETYYTYSLFSNLILSRLVMDVSGELKQLVAFRGHQTWSATYSQLREQSDAYPFCGEFGVSSNTLRSFCTCLQGFVPFSNENERINRIHGCERKTPLQCENSASPKGKKHEFFRISDLELPANSKEHQLTREGSKSACLENCSCTAYVYVGSVCSMWSGALLNLKKVSHTVKDRQDLFVKVANSELHDHSGYKKSLKVIVAVVVTVGGPVLGVLICFITRNIKWGGHGKKDSSQNLLTFDFSSSSDGVDKQIKNENNVMGNNNDFVLPLFSYSSISAATNNFSASNKLGEGGFGAVYKGKSLKGQEIAVKRLSRRYGQGLEEFRNEILLIAKLQHRNLVRLLGCCHEQDENILVYEYMPNKSLDFLLFDPIKQVLLEWGTRIRIIQGIAQGLLYLHQYSRLRIIHRDIKASNILLDSKMNPKISDFGLARIFDGNDSEANTKRIVGTYGYMAPEYALDGLFSIKSDVFSFGILILEIVSGKKNTGFYNSDALNLIEHAWKLWTLNRALELTDSLLHCPPAVAVLRCINIGLLCVQENPYDRPTMSDVVLMFGNELLALASPKQPAFTACRIVIKTTSTSSNAQNVSVNGLTFSLPEPQ